MFIRLPLAVLAGMILLFACPAFAEESAAAKTPTASASAVQDAPVKILGDTVEYFYEEQKAVGVGNIRIDYQDMRLGADKVTVNMRTKEAWAEGNVTLEQEGVLYKGDWVYIDYQKGTADAKRMTAVLPPRYVAKGGTVKRTEEKNYIIKDGYVTTCDNVLCDEKATPHYRISSKEAVIYPDDKIVLKHNVVWIEKLPVFYIPILVIPMLDIDQFPLQVQVGERSDWGKFILTKMRYYDSHSFRGNVIFDYREKQKYAGGFENFYDTHRVGQGAARFYYVDDRYGEGNADGSYSQTHLAPESSRYRAQIRHSWKIDSETALLAEFNKISDKHFIEDFFYLSEFEDNPFPDNYVYWVKGTDDYTLSVLNRFRFDDFLNVVERTPEVRLDTHTRSWGDSPLYYRHQIQASRLNKRVDTDYAPGAEQRYPDEFHQEALRTDVRHRFSYVWPWWDWFTVTPFIGARETYYSRDQEGTERDFIRTNLESGFDLSNKFFRVYDVNWNVWGQKIDKLRHVVTPNVSYRYQSEPTHLATDLYDFDSVDEVGRENFIRFDLENKLQTKSFSRENKLSDSRTWVRSIVFLDFETRQWDKGKAAFAGSELEWSPNDRWTFHTDTVYDFENNYVGSANLDVVYRVDRWWIGVGQRYSKEFSNQTTAQVDWKINDRYRLRMYERFEANTMKLDEFETILEVRNILCWTVKLTFNMRRTGPEEILENAFFISFSPTNFSETAFRSGRTYPVEDPFLMQSDIMSSST